jgi:hypothetical protein
MTDTASWARRAGSTIVHLPEWLALAFEGWREHRRLRRELETLDERGELQRTLRDSRIAAGEVGRLLRAHPRTQEQLDAMMHHLGIDRAALPHSAAVADELRDIEWRCNDCRNWRHCRAWLEGDRDAENPRDFCPNAAAFDALRAAAAPAAGASTARSAA